MKFLSLTLPGGQQIQGPSEIETINRNAGPFAENIVRNTVWLLFLLAIILALFYLIWGGFQWLMSGGDKEKLAKAHHTIIYVIIGITVIFMSFLIINLIGGFFKIDLLRLGS